MSKYEMKDLSQEESIGEKPKRNGGCYIKTATGFILALLSIAIAVGIGLIVHFAENRKTECVFPGSAEPRVATQSGANNKEPCLTQLSTPGTQISIGSTLTPATTAKPMLKEIRLPKALIPNIYHLRLQPEFYDVDPKTFTFHGTVEIELNCTESTQNVTLHINMLNISSIVFSSLTASASLSTIRYESHSEDKDRQFLIINLSEETTPGAQYKLLVNFSGPLRDDLRGFYLSSYKEGNTIEYVATTQFEATDARKAFPCFDEPAMKAKFRVTLVRQKTFMSLSNMPLNNSINIGQGYVEDHYQTSLDMSTYLLAFVIGKFDKIKNTTKDNITYGAWARPSSKGQTKFALDVGIQTIVNYENYFGQKFPLPKQDMIALPDFRAGAMENWGLITYREAAMLFDPVVGSEATRQRIASVITHELAHQWFGDLVTMAWWDDIWLNEGFATFVEYIGVDLIYPDWKMFEQFASVEMHSAFELDSLVTSHPIYVPVDNPDEIRDVFDAISYAKGGSVLRMLQFILGDETFKNGLKLYLDHNKYSNADHNHLWSALEEQANQDGRNVSVKTIMDHWTLQMNYPVVMVNVDIEKSILHIKQQRFLRNQDSVDPGKYRSTFGYEWHIPFTFTTSANPDFSINGSAIRWLNKNSTDIPYVQLKKDDWVLGNVNQYGFYRVNYPEENWKALIKQLKTDHKVISTINRAQLINDAWSLAKAGQLSTAIALEILEYLDKELDYVPWFSTMKQIQYLDDMLGKSSLYGSFRSFMMSKLTAPFKHYTLNDDNSTHLETLTRSNLASLACSYGVQDCVVEARQQFANWMDSPDSNPIDPDLRKTVYCTGIADGGDEEWNFVYSQYLSASVVTEKNTLGEALACTKSAWLLSRYLEMCLDPSVIRKQDIMYVLVSIARNPVGRLLAWDFVREKWDYLMNSYGKGAISVARVIDGITSTFNTEFQFNQLKELLIKYNDMSTLNRASQQSLEMIQTNIKWVQSNTNTISKWLESIGVKVNNNVKDVRLPLHLSPTTYEITLQPNMYEGDPKSFNFTGHVKIYMNATGVGSNVTLHVNKLTIDESSIKFDNQDGKKGPHYKGQRFSDLDRQFEIFFLDGYVTAGELYYIEMNFTGPLTGDLAGLYLSEYKRGNQTIYIATTQFEPTDARKAFPCFDEPQLKATFQVNLIRRADKVSISNMLLTKKESVHGNMVMDIYNTSAKMSTYLLAFIVCDFKYTSNITQKGIQYRAWARPESVNQTDVALKTGSIVLDYYAEYFGIGFPLQKQDMIAIPDFAAGAMENWGLITYRETAMLYESKVSSLSNLQRVNVVVAHELAHQWFGDLVTMQWWDDLWLNEGFASFVEYIGVDHVHPEWKMFEQFAFELYDVFDIDSLTTSHPIYVPVQNPDEINEIFDTISYGKGGSVLRMMRFFLGESTFQKGLQNYLTTKQYGNANHNDLWDALEKQAILEGKNISVTVILNTWLLQMNYPVVTVTKDSKGQIRLTQSRFLKNKNSKDPGTYPSPYNYTWYIPFTYTTGDSANFNVTDKDVVWMNETEKTLTSTYPKDWIIGNVHYYGVYRVNYENDNWLKLIDQLNRNHSAIHVMNRGQLINDAFGLAQAKLLNMTTALKVLDYLNNETEYVPWTAAGSEMGYISTMLRETELYGHFERFMQDKVQTQFARLGFNYSGSDLLESYLRSTIASYACAYGISNCTQNAIDLYKTYMKNSSSNPIDPELKTTFYCTAVREGGEAEWNFAYKLYMEATVQAEQVRLLSALCCTRKVWILHKLLGLALDDTVVRKQDAYRVFIAVGSNPVGKSIAWDFFRSKWDIIYKMYGTGSFSMSDIVSGVTSSFNTEFRLLELKEFQKAHPDMGSGTRAFAQTLENTMTNIQWMKDNYDIVKEWLQKYKNKESLS